MDENEFSDVSDVIRDATVRSKRWMPKANKTAGASGFFRGVTHPGAVYVMEKDGRVKVGFSTDPERRARQLDAPTVAFEHRHDDARWLEKVAHRLLINHCVEGEWFSCSAETAIEAVKSADALYSQGY